MLEIKILLRLRQISKKLGKFFGKWNGETGTTEQIGGVIYNQIQKVTRAESPPMPSNGQNWWWTAPLGWPFLPRHITDHKV